jgi:voltage-gated potassium channel
MTKLQEQIQEIIFETRTKAGKAFDVALIAVIIFSVIVVILESIEPIKEEYGKLLYELEWFFTIIFLIEYFLRLYCFKSRLKYALSFYGIIDLLACLPSFISLFFPGAQSLIVIRSLRLLRIFRVFKLATYFDEAVVIGEALKSARNKIFVFLFAVFIIVIISGTTMYLVEGTESGFTSIPAGMYWAVVTLTTVGYGDIVPTTQLGKFLASLLMINGYAIIAVPTGIVTSEFTRSQMGKIAKKSCKSCGAEGHQKDARFCLHCGETL